MDPIADAGKRQENDVESASQHTGTSFHVEKRKEEVESRIACFFLCVRVHAQVSSLDPVSFSFSSHLLPFERKERKGSTGNIDRTDSDTSCLL